MPHNRRFRYTEQKSEAHEAHENSDTALFYDVELTMFQINKLTSPKLRPMSHVLNIAMDFASYLR